MSMSASSRMWNTNNKNGCIECNLPSNHSCRKCKRCVCSLCCAGKRELKNAWWCGTSFRTQTVANQQLIRDGLYSSDDEEVWQLVLSSVVYNSNWNGFLELQVLYQLATRKDRNWLRTLCESLRPLQFIVVKRNVEVVNQHCSELMEIDRHNTYPRPN